jgi:hypothetical protein
VKIDDILKSYPFSHKFLVSYSYDCAMDVLPLFEKQHPNDNRPRTTLETVSRWLQGNATLQEVSDAASNAARAYYAAYYAALAAATDYAAAANAANAASNAASNAALDAANAASNAANAASNAARASSSGKGDDYYKQLLLTKIDKELTKFEKAVLGLED